MKRAFCLLLTIVLTLSMAVPSVAAATPRIAKVTEAAFFNYEKNAAIDPERTVVEDEIIIPLVKAGFEDADGAEIEWNSSTPDLGPTVAQLRSNHVTPKLYVAKGNALIRDIEIVHYKPTKRVRATAAIRVRFVEELASTREIEYEFKIRLVHDGVNTEVREVFAGRISNPIIEVDGTYNNEEYVDLSDGAIVECNGSVENIEADLGGGVSAFVNMTKGEKYYGVAKYEHNEGQDAILKAYKEIDGFFKLTTINLNTASNGVKLGIPNDTPYYVYNQLGNYLGLSNQLLPYATKYYISAKEVIIEVPEDDLTFDTVDFTSMSDALKRFNKQT